MKQLPLWLAFGGGLALGVGAGWMAFRSAPAPATARPAESTANPASAVVPPSPAAPAAEPARKAERPKGAANAPAATAAPVVQEDPAVPKLEAALAEARSKLAEWETRHEAQAAEQAKLTAAETELRAQLARAAAETEELKRDLQQRAQRLTELEAARQRAAQDAASGAKNLARLRELAGEMDDLNRRREAYLTNVLTRYRETTDLLRTMSLRLDNPRDAATPLNNDLSRIQQAVQHADEDLRQLRSLNARAVKLQKDLAQASTK